MPAGRRVPNETADRICCPKCGEDLCESGEMSLVGWVLASRDHEGKARADLVLDCECGAQLNVFVPFEDFHLIEDGT